MSILWGVWQNDIDNNGDTPGTGTDTALTKRPSVVVINRPWYNLGYVTVASFVSVLNLINSNGQIPLLNWSPTSWNGTPPSPLTDANIASGAHDAGFLNAFADAIAALPYRVMIMQGEEINLSGNPWFDATGTNYIAMYKHVVDLFDGRGVTNVSWCWDVNEVTPSGILSTWWPGNKTNGRPYVDWALLDTFNQAYNKAVTWETFEQIMKGDGSYNGDSWTKLLALDNTGLVHFGLGSFGSDNRTGTGVDNFAGRASWLVDAFGTQIPHFGSPTTDYSKLELVLLFNQNESSTTTSDLLEHWSVTVNDSNSLAAFTGPNGPGASGYYVAGGKYLPPAGPGKIGGYRANGEVSAFDTAILSAAPSHLKAFYKLNEASGTTAADSSGSALNGTYTGGFTLGGPKIVPGTIDTSVLFNGTTGYVTVPDNAAFSIPTTGALTIMVAFSVVALPTGFATLVSKGGDGTGFEWAVRVSSAGALEGISWNLGGATYVDATSANVVSAGQNWVLFVTFDQSRSPIGRIAYAQIGATSLTFTNSVGDTPANASTDGTGTLSIGRRSDNSQFSNAVASRVPIWNTALSDLSMTEILKAAAIRRDKPRMSGVG